MKNLETDINCDLMIIGTGMAGMAAALFAAQSGIDSCQAGAAGQLGFASGLIDVLGIHPVKKGRVAENPWQAIENLHSDNPWHPYARMEISEIKTAVKTVLAFLEDHGYPHVFHEEKNMTMPTAAGTLKPSYAVPHTMAAGPASLSRQEPCLLVDFSGLQGFSSRQIAAGLADSWPKLRPVQISFPGASGELHSERMARALEARQNREKLTEAVSLHLGDAGSVALPAVLGISRTLEVAGDIARGLGVPVFEIPTMVPGVTGLRLREKFEHNLPSMGIRQFLQQTVLEVHGRTGKRWKLEVGNSTSSCMIYARAVILCSGRFMGGGLHADRHGIKETVFGLPVAQPPDRASWHHRDLLHPGGHPVNRAGLAVDEKFRPVDSEGKTLYNNVFAAGSVLAEQDWMRQKCGSGLAFATAYKAVNACRELLEEN